MSPNLSLKEALSVISVPMNLLVSTAYLTPIPYFSLFMGDSPLYMDSQEFFQKQSFRNRGHILSPQGILPLSVPIQKGSRRGIPIREVKISDEFKWQRLHWMSLQSCYRRSSYFEFYEDEIVGFFEKTYTYLWDLNLDWIHFIGHSYGLDMGQKIKILDTYQKEWGEGWLDLREEIHPKKIKGIPGEIYPQVFSNLGQFYEDISILDLLFNLGKQGIPYLKNLVFRTENIYNKGNY
jgi:hypothetical protein